MESNSYQFEAKYIRVIMNWRACDEWGLSPLIRSWYNYELLINDLMIWCHGMHKSMISVCWKSTGLYRLIFFFYGCNNHGILYTIIYRDITNRGLTIESLIAYTTNIESREQKHFQCQPRTDAGTSQRKYDWRRWKFFSVLRDAVSKHFTCKDVVCLLRGSILSYILLSHIESYEGLHPEFSLKDQLSNHNPRNQRVRRYEQPISVDMGLASLPTPGAWSIRLCFRNVPIEHPPPSRPYNPVFEHSYSK